MYTWIEINSPTDMQLIGAALSSEYDPPGVVKKLTAGLSGAVKRVLIEQNYIDKDYRSTYYNFYSKKGQHYCSDCVRIHLFNETVNFDPRALRFSWPGVRLDDHYFGYVVVRPTGIATIGRSIVSPDVRCGAKGCVITTEHKVQLLGYELMLEGFPSMDQHIDISVCAHAACWSILRHYSERWSAYREFLVHDITLMAQQFNPGGLVPSKGLELSHAERVFQEAGTFPIVVARRKDDDISFYRQLHAYVESGFPLFAAMHSRSHAVAVVGYEWKVASSSSFSQLRYAWEEVKSLVAVDDHYLPYLPVSAHDSPKDLPDRDYTGQNIDAFIVALPEKIYYPADAVDQIAPQLFMWPINGLPPKEEAIVRYFLTTCSSLRRFMRKRESEFDPKLLEVVMQLPFAQYVWVVEISTASEWATGQISARAILDATASLREFFPFWLFHSRDTAIISDRKAVGSGPSGMRMLQLTGMKNTALTRFEQNLRRTQPK